MLYKKNIFILSIIVVILSTIFCNESIAQTHELISKDEKELGTIKLAQVINSYGQKSLEDRIQLLENELAILKTKLQEKTQENVKETKKEHFSLNLAPDTMLKLSGFIQARAWDSQTTLNTHKVRPELDLRRVRVAFTGDIGKKTFLQYSFDVGRNGPSTRDAFFDYRVTPWLIARAGQFKLPTSHETLLSGSEVLFERAFVTLRLFPSVRDRGFMWDTDLSKFIHIPLSAQFGVVNGSGIGQSDNNDAKDLFTSLLFKWKYFDLRGFFQRGKFEFAQNKGSEIVTDKVRAVVSAHGIFGLGKDKLWESYGNYAWAHGDFLHGSSALKGTLGILDDFNNEDVRGFNVILLRRLFKESPITLWGKYDRFDPNIHLGGDSIEIASYGSKLDLTKNLSVLAGIFHKNFHKIGHDTTFSLQTQLKY